MYTPSRKASLVHVGERQSGVAFLERASSLIEVQMRTGAPSERSGVNSPPVGLFVRSWWCDF
jgi:hypothetical protein